ncbi:hypothetical protein F4778DRAFT_137672 [Xylariomycetidae sp. FL2044]|nr:hypothetical protein F4778DRAFT_137672 [Xylariomycetidae sp. FL2044]
MTIKTWPKTTEACCTCAMLLSNVPRHRHDEKPLPANRTTECCTRVICGKCIDENSRFRTYCPFCQISQTDTVLPPGLKTPPSYEFATSSSSASKISPSHAPPPYTPLAIRPPLSSEDKKVPPEEEPAQDISHFLNHSHDTVTSLSLRYGVPAPVLRRANNITSDHLILGRRTVIIPGEFYKGGVSLSPRPIEGEEEEARKAKIRRWMVGCKVHEYDVAVLYLEQAGYNLDLAIEAYRADEEWERTHPVNGSGRGKASSKFHSGRSSRTEG